MMLHIRSNFIWHFALRMYLYKCKRREGVLSCVFAGGAIISTYVSWYDSLFTCTMKVLREYTHKIQQNTYKVQQH